jgi:hypothetical protein
MWRTQVLTSAPSCLTDPAILSGELKISDCPSLDQLLTDIQANVTDPPVSCDAGCVGVFGVVGAAGLPACRGVRCEFTRWGVAAPA